MLALRGFLHYLIIQLADGVSDTPMNEDEKRALALAFMEQEQLRLKNSTFADHSQLQLDAVARSALRQQQLKASLAQQGITWQQLKDTYDEAYARGEAEMMDFKLSFFFAAAAIAFHEKYETDPDTTAAFTLAVPHALNGETDAETIISRCLSETGVDVRGVDTPPPSVKSILRDKAAVERMKKTGITAADLEKEKQIGYQHGWNKQFRMSVCYASVALELFHEHGVNAGEIEQFLERVSEIMDEEISAADILERCRQETGVDVEGLTKE